MCAGVMPQRTISGVPNRSPFMSSGTAAPGKPMPRCQQIRAAQQLRRRLAAAIARRFDGELMRRREAAIGAEDRHARTVERLRERPRAVAHGLCVRAAELAPVEQRDRKRGGFRHVEIRCEPGVRDLLDALRQH